MTDAEIDALDGMELRRAVAEAVGWRWSYIDDAGGHREFAIVGDRWIFQSHVPLIWDDAIAACEAAGIKQVILRQDEDRLSVNWNGYHSPCSPESLCRALLKAIAAKGGAA